MGVSILQAVSVPHTADDIHSARLIFLIMGNAGFIPSTVLGLDHQVWVGVGVAPGLHKTLAGVFLEFVVFSGDVA